MEKEDFAHRLTQLRMQKGISARDMSLSIGQSAGYINNIENGVNLPSMTTFFYICDYFGITPKDFFDIDSIKPPQVYELMEMVKSLNPEQLSSVIALIKSFKK
ncbi:MAG: helix-turn-helix domain-containing protein [Faecalibacterium sp.]|nr:helix-turn-helix domain-containing protein [Ruminococcus sp.]MCM1392583.1 helix-turn-helix domain-containing protein [Ruminococcus sp.]MCM1486275.1 helix-turn-helix domain-containing protein [Faecalibacterium sp.]